MALIGKSIPAFENAWSVGAKTVNGPEPSSVDTRLACAKAATRELCTPVFAAFVGISSVESALTCSGNAEATSNVIIMNVRTLFIILSDEGGVISECFFSPKLTFLDCNRWLI